MVFEVDAEGGQLYYYGGGTSRLPGWVIPPFLTSYPCNAGATFDKLNGVLINITSHTGGATQDFHLPAPDLYAFFIVNNFSGFSQNVNCASTDLYMNGTSYSGSSYFSLGNYHSAIFFSDGSAWYGITS